GGTDQGLAVVNVRADKGSYVQNLHLLRDAYITGTLHDAAGQPISEATIEWLSEDGKWADRTTTNADGLFVLANLPSVRGRLLAWHKDSSWPFAIAHADGVAPNSGTVALVCEVGQSSTLRLLPSAVPECRLADLRVRVRHVETNMSRGISAPQQTSKLTDGAGVDQMVI